MIEPVLGENLMKATIQASFNGMYNNNNYHGEDKDIYPMPNFIISTPQEVETSNRLNLIYDAKILHSSSINKSQIDP